jgi:tetratricopeptide (TPR) repeat protein
MISFGSGTQTGDITFGNITSGDVINLSINIHVQEERLNKLKQTVKNEGLDGLWLRAVEYQDEQDWIEAEGLFARIKRINPDYRDVQKRHLETQKQVMLLKFYRDLCHKDEDEWFEVKRGLAILEYKYPNYPDPNHLREWVEQQEMRITLQRSAERAFEEEDWKKVIDILQGILVQFPNNDEAIELLNTATEIQEREIRWQKEEIERKRRLHEAAANKQRKMARHSNTQTNPQLSLQPKSIVPPENQDITPIIATIFIVLVAIILCMAIFYQ